MPAAMPIATVAAIMNIDGLQLAQLLQLTSPSLPVGGFSWSQGTESAIEQGWLKGEEGFAGWLQGILQHSFVFQEWPLLQRLYEAFSVADQERLQYWNALALALRETRELRQEDVQMGAALLRLCRDLNYPRALAWEQNEISYLTADKFKFTDYNHQSELNLHNSHFLNNSFASFDFLGEETPVGEP